MQFQTPATNELCTAIWKPWAPGKMKIFSWLLHLDRLWCNDRLKRRGWPNGYFFPLCIRHLETSVHLFWECNLARETWRRMATRNGCGPLNPGSWNNTGNSLQRVQRCLQRFANEKTRKAAASIIMITCWEIWKERNDCIFKGKTASAEDILSRIARSPDLWSVARPKSVESLLGSPGWERLGLYVLLP